MFGRYETVEKAKPTKRDRTEYMRKYRQDNKDKIKQKNIERYQNNKEKIKQQKAKYRQENSDRIKQKNAEYRQKNREEINKKAREYLARKAIEFQEQYGDKINSAKTTKRKARDQENDQENVAHPLKKPRIEIIEATNRNINNEQHSDVLPMRNVTQPITMLNPWTQAQLDEWKKSFPKETNRLPSDVLPMRNVTQPITMLNPWTQAQLDEWRKSFPKETNRLPIMTLVVHPNEANIYRNPIAAKQTMFNNATTTNNALTQTRIFDDMVQVVVNVNSV